MGNVVQREDCPQRESPQHDPRWPHEGQRSAELQGISERQSLLHPSAGAQQQRREGLWRRGRSLGRGSGGRGRRLGSGEGALSTLVLRRRLL